MLHQIRAILSLTHQQSHHAELPTKLIHGAQPGCDKSLLSTRCLKRHVRKPDCTVHLMFPSMTKDTAKSFSKRPAVMGREGIEPAIFASNSLNVEHDRRQEINGERPPRAMSSLWFQEPITFSWSKSMTLVSFKRQ